MHALDRRVYGQTWKGLHARTLAERTLLAE
jgi:hypothetical protein